jgi:hypothetical protein
MIYALARNVTREVRISPALCLRTYLRTVFWDVYPLSGQLSIHQHLRLFSIDQHSRGLCRILFRCCTMTGSPRFLVYLDIRICQEAPSPRSVQLLVP